MNSVESTSTGGLRFEALPSDTRLCFVFRKSVRVGGRIATRTDDISGCGEPDPLLKARRLLAERFGELEVREESSVRAGA